MNLQRMLVEYILYREHVLRPNRTATSIAHSSFPNQRQRLSASFPIRRLSSWHLSTFRIPLIPFRASGSVIHAGGTCGISSSEDIQTSCSNSESFFRIERSVVSRVGILTFQFGCFKLSSFSQYELNFLIAERSCGRRRIIAFRSR